MTFAAEDQLSPPTEALVVRIAVTAASCSDLVIGQALVHLQGRREIRPQSALLPLQTDRREAAAHRHDLQQAHGGILVEPRKLIEREFGGFTPPLI